MTGNAAQQGSILLATIKSFAMGELLGQANATKGARRVVAAHSYRGCLSVGTQPGHADVIFNDASGGLPQRFLWAPVVDPNMPLGEFPIPEPLAMDMPDWGTGNDGVVEVVYRYPAIKSTIVETYVANVRGEGNPLDSHAVLTRCKVAALLAIMHGRLEVTEREWDWSATVMELSNGVRVGLEQDEARIRVEALRQRGVNDAIRNEGRDNYVVESVKRSVLNTLGKRNDGEASGSDLSTAMGKSDRRKVLPQALADLAGEGVITELKVPGGYRYRLTGDVQGELSVQGSLEQVSGGEHRVQGEPADGVVSRENHRSKKIDTKAVSCQKWFDGYLNEKRRAGEATVDAVAVRAAGKAAGYSPSSLYVAANKRGYKGPVWSLIA